MCMDRIPTCSKIDQVTDLEIRITRQAHFTWRNYFLLAGLDLDKGVFHVYVSNFRKAHVQP